MLLTIVVEDEPGGQVYPFVSLSPDRIPDNIHKATITQKDHNIVPAKADIFKCIPQSTITPNTASFFIV